MVGTVFLFGGYAAPTVEWAGVGQVGWDGVGWGESGTVTKWLAAPEAWQAAVLHE